MSLVGPRPHAIGSLAGDKLFWEVDPRYWQRHSLRPGLTGLAQIRGLRGATEREVDLTSRLQADLEYLSGWTIWRDVKHLVGDLAGHVPRPRLLTRFPCDGALPTGMATGVPEAAFHTLPDGRQIAFRQVPGQGPDIRVPAGLYVRHGGQQGNRAAWLGRAGRPCLPAARLLRDAVKAPAISPTATLSGWCEEVVALVEARTEGPVVLVGSSMGGWLMLLAARALGRSGLRAGRDRRSAGLHRLGLLGGSEGAAGRRRDPVARKSLRPRADSRPSRVLGRWPDPAPAQRSDSVRRSCAAAAWSG